MDIDLKDVLSFLQDTARQFGAEVTSPWFYLQFGLILAGAGIAFATDAMVHARVDMNSLAMRWPLPLRHFARVMVSSASTAVFAVLMIISRLVMWHITWPSRSYLLMVSAKLALAWLAIRLVTSVIQNAFIVRLVSISAWLVAALSIIGQLGWAADTLDSVAIEVGGLRLSPLLMIKAGALVIVALWLTNIASNFAESQINRASDLTPSIQVLLIKIIRIGLMVVAIAIALSAVGINLSALAVFSGAVGVGIGIGLQKIVANFISGHHPACRQIGEARRPRHHRRQFGPHQRDEDALHLGRRRRRARVPDPERGSGDAKGHQLDLYRQEHAGEDRLRHQLRRRPAGWSASSRPRPHPPHPRAIKGKAPNCILTEFAETGMKFSLTFWIADPDGMDNVKSDVMLSLWDAFKREGIRVPYPVREIRVRGGALPVESVVEVSS